MKKLLAIIVASVALLSYGSAALADSATYIRAYGAGTTITANTFTKITFSTEDYDTGGEFASSKFTVVNAGYYRITSSVQLPSTATTPTVSAIYKNGTAAQYEYCGPPASQAITCTVTTTLSLAANDYIEIFAKDAAGSATNGYGTAWESIAIERLDYSAGGGSSLPADAAGWLENDGAGTLSWSTPPSTLPSAAEGYLFNDGADALSWEAITGGSSMETTCATGGDYTSAVWEPCQPFGGLDVVAMLGVLACVIIFFAVGLWPQKR